MKRIGISTRLDKVPGRVEQRDALDALWPSLLWNLGYAPLPLCSGIEDVPAYLQALNLDGFILSGGNDIGSAPNRDRLEKGILDYSTSRGLPVLGVCRGMQFINDYCGGSLMAILGHVATRHTLVGEWAKDNGFLEVNSYHNQAIVDETLSHALVVLAKAEDGAIEALRHKTLPWLGVMWHPEREETLTKNDIILIKKHFGSETL